jgi:hypothetical protein
VYRNSIIAEARMTNSIFFYVVTLILVCGGFAAMALDTPNTQFCCLIGAMAALLIAVRLERKGV